MINLTDEELKDIYTEDYVSKYHKEDTGRLKNVIENIDFNKDDNVIDFACGNGLLAGIIADKVNHYTGIDFSKPFIEDARKRNNSLKNVDFIESDIVQFNKNHQNTFSKAFTMDFSEHIYDEQFITIYRSIYDSLKNGGELFIHTPDGNYFLEILKARGILKQVTGHIAVRNFMEYKRLLQEVGFSKIEHKTLPHYVPILKKLSFLSKVPLIGKYFKARIFIKCTK
ncbi:MAG: hypothetical protein CR982_01685 [Candidatus Cloacimonadota bacterium]|nr:MAG: hypothetical protein CR982_01685 [Candidatus Cloacimonadota bacterium]PIE79025.1 MAG: hypothetical protein CSA15_04845 [Candidatus Delongbacteria bacterium]